MTQSTDFRCVDVQQIVKNTYDQLNAEGMDVHSYVEQAFAEEL